MALAAAALGMTAAVIGVSAKQAERAYPPRGRFLEIDGVRLHYIEKGEGPALVILHGNGAMVQDIESSGLLDRLAGDFRVVVFDRPGFGYTDRPRSRIWGPRAQAALIRRAMQALGIADAVVLGHSWGTLVALALALDHPEAVRGLGLLSGYYFPSLRLDVPLMMPPAIPVLGDLIRYTISPILGHLFAERILAKVFAPLPVPDRFRREVPVSLALRPWQIRANAADAALMVPAAAELYGRYGELAIPVLIVTGAEDRIVNPKAQSARLHRELPDSEYLTIEGAGHMVHHAAPDQIAEAVTRLARRRPPATTPARTAGKPKEPVSAAPAGAA